MKTKERLEEIDILKALGILCAVFGHSGAAGTEFVYMFHMPIFFMASGYVYSEKHSQNLLAIAKNTKAKLLRLWLPYFFWNSLFILLNNVFLDLNIYTNNPAIYQYVGSTVRANYTYLSYTLSKAMMIEGIKQSALFGAPTILGGAFWFMGTLFCISVVYPVIDWLFRKCFRVDPIAPQTVIAVLLLVQGFRCGYNSPGFYGSNRFFSCYILYHLGRVLKEYNVPALFKTKGQHILLGVCSLAILVGMYSQRPGYSVNLWRNEYVDPVFLVIASVSGWGLVYSISHFLKETPLKKPLLYIGKRTMSIMLLHYVFFRAVAFVVVQVYDLPDFCLGAHAHLYGDRGLWWLAYFVAGVAGPILAYNLYKKVKDFILPAKR